MCPALRIEGGEVVGIVPDRGKVYGEVEGWPVVVTGRSGGFEVKLDNVPRRPTFYEPGETLILDNGIVVKSITEGGLRSLLSP